MLLRHTCGHGFNKGTASVMRVAVFVDGHDIDLYPDAEGAAREIEGYDAMSLDYSVGTAPSTWRPSKALSGDQSPCIQPRTIVWTTWSVCSARSQKTEACRCRLKPQ